MRKLWSNRMKRDLAKTLYRRYMKTCSDSYINPSLISKFAKKIKNRKTPGLDDIHNELIKYGGKKLHDLRNCIKKSLILELYQLNGKRV